MDPEKTHTPTGPRAIPRQIVQGHNSPRKSIANGVPTESGRKHHAPVKSSSSSKKHPTHQRIPRKTTSIAGHSVNRQVEGGSRRHGCPTISHTLTPLPTPHSKRLGTTHLRPLSHLESLPTEILEQIYFCTLSVNSGGECLSLPRASPTIGTKLSSDYVHKELFVRVCSDPHPTKWQENYGRRKESTKEYAKAQSWILRQQWVNPEFVRDCIREYMVPILVHELTKHKVGWLEEGPLLKPELELVIRSYISEHIEEPCASSYSLEKSYYTRHPWTERDHIARNIVLGLNPHMGFISLEIEKACEARLKGPKRRGISPPEFYAQWRILSLSSTTQIPSRLLHGPWTLPKIELLELMISGGATVDWIHTTAGEVAEQGFLDALGENNARALRALCVAGGSMICPSGMADAERTAVHTRGVGVIPQQKHLLMAIDLGCKKEVVETLVNAKESECNLQTPEIVHRIHQMENKGWPARAAWLAKKRQGDWGARMAGRGWGSRGGGLAGLISPPTTRDRHPIGFLMK